MPERMSEAERLIGMWSLIRKKDGRVLRQGGHDMVIFGIRIRVLVKAMSSNY